MSVTCMTFENLKEMSWNSIFSAHKRCNAINDPRLQHAELCYTCYILIYTRFLQMRPLNGMNKIRRFRSKCTVILLNKGE